MLLCCSPLLTLPGNFCFKNSRQFLCDLPQSSPGTCYYVVVHSTFFPGNFCFKISWHFLCKFPPNSPGTCLHDMFVFCIVLHSSHFRAISMSRFKISRHFHHIFPPSSPGTCLQFIMSLFSALHFSRKFLCRDFQALSLQYSTKFTRHFFAVYNVSVLFITPHFSRLFLCQDFWALFFGAIST